jgi:uncharacterized membrane protein HdeD (DUF308 family)
VLLLIISGVLGLVLGIFLLFLPLIVKLMNKFSENVNLERGPIITRIFIGIAQILIGLFLVSTGIAYHDLLPLVCLGILIILTGILFVFFPNLLNRLNEWGNLVLFSESESGAWQRIIYAVLLLLMGIYIIYFSTR